MISKGPAPGFINHPNHRVQITPSANHWTVRVGQILVADSTTTLLVEETGYEPVVYFPPGEVSMDYLVQTEQRTTCPFKGEARYFVDISGKTSEPVAWTYPAVFDEVSPIRAYVAFYDKRVNLEKR
jgi:uncharacterized protein (DUF427 family)